MAAADNEVVYLENANQLKDWMEAGCKPVEDWRIGTEHEKFGFRTKDHTPLPYAGPDGIQAMLEGLMRFGWQGKYEGDVLVGLSRGGEAGGGRPVGAFRRALEKHSSDMRRGEHASGRGARRGRRIGAVLSGHWLCAELGS